MNKLIILAVTLLFSTKAFTQQKAAPVAATKTQAIKSNYLLDKESIKSMIGCYKVSFEFGETFAPDTAYKYHDRKVDWGVEHVLLVEESDKKISLQHLLIISDSIIIKHWRQDWIYENTDLLTYYKDNEWKKVQITAEQAKGTWTQKVFQVDDSPRYEGYGTWVHVDGRHFWESTADAPLPRREYTIRNDYNVTKRHSHVEITADGWVLEQDNEKIVRGNGLDKLICWEKGIEKFTKGSYNCQPALDYWERNKKYWVDVRNVWEEVFKVNTALRLNNRITDKLLYEQLFELAKVTSKIIPHDSNGSIASIKKIIDLYTIKK
jgi:hypothetical protein